MEAPPIDIDSLPDDVPTLQKMVRQLYAENAELRAQLAELRAELAELRSRHDSLARRAYGRRSERSRKATARRDKKGESDKPPPERHRHGRAPLPESLPRREVIHDLCDAEKACPDCGHQRRQIGRQVSEQLDYQPPRYSVLRTVRLSYACRRCQPAEAPTPRRVSTAGPATVGPIPKGLCGPGLLAYVLTSKFADHLPLHRLAGIIARSGVKIARSTLGGWVARSAELMRPLYDLMHRRILAGEMLFSDDTRSRYLVPGQDQSSRGYFWVGIGDSSAPYTVFDFTKGYSAKEGPQRFMAGFTGYLHADCLRQYDPIFEGGARHVACWAHARRKFLDAGRAGEAAVELIGELYRIEAGLPEPDTPESIRKRAEVRRGRSREVLAGLKRWLTEQSPRALPKSPLGEAARYVLGRWQAFCRYTERGDLAIDNNLSERTLRQIAVGRGNWTFLGSASSGRSAAVHYTLVGSCRHLGLDPFAYLSEAMPAVHGLGEKPAEEELAEWLPDRWAARRQEDHIRTSHNAA